MKSCCFAYLLTFPLPSQSSILKVPNVVPLFELPVRNNKHPTLNGGEGKREACGLFCSSKYQANFVEFILTPERSEIQNEDYVKCRNMYYHYVTAKI